MINKDFNIVISRYEIIDYLSTKEIIVDYLYEHISKLYKNGMSIKEIADVCNVSERTVNYYLNNDCEKLEVVVNQRQVISR